MKSEIKSLTGLRGIAAFIVMLYHFGEPYNTLGVITHFRVPKGYLAVDLFYVLSGFILAYNYGENFCVAFSAEKYLRFLWRRIARLYPAYIVILLFFVIKMAINFSGGNPYAQFRAFDFPANVLMITGWGLDVRPVVVDSWSVSAELVCYLLFPGLLFLAIFSRPSVCLMLAFTAAAALVAVVMSKLGVKGPLDVVSKDSGYPLLRSLADFSFGLIAFRIWSIPVMRERLGSNVGLSCCLIILVIFAALKAHDLIVIACFPFLIVAISSGSSLAAAIFSNPAAYVVGECSYSLYLVHDIFLTTSVRLEKHIETSLGLNLYAEVAAVGMIISIFAAWLIYRWVELPGKYYITAAATWRGKSSSGMSGQAR